MAAVAERLKEAMELKELKQANVIRLAQPFESRGRHSDRQEPHMSQPCGGQDRAKA